MKALLKSLWYCCAVLAAVTRQEPINVKRLLQKIELLEQSKERKLVAAVKTAACKDST